jgi:hypothetical protein
MSAVRVTLVLAAAAAYAAAALLSEHSLAMAVGLAPLAWIAAESCWRLFDRER